MKQENAALRGKVAVVTGGSKGIGRSIALSLARQGADIIVISRHLDSARYITGATIVVDGGFLLRT